MYNTNFPVCHEGPFLVSTFIHFYQHMGMCICEFYTNICKIIIDNYLELYYIDFLHVEKYFWVKFDKLNTFQEYLSSVICIY